MGRIIEVTDLILRAAHQSLMATRMAMEDMVPACEDLDNAGYWSLECWGGATFDSCIRFLNEDPWERLRTFRICGEAAPGSAGKKLRDDLEDVPALDLLNQEVLDCRS